MKRRQAIIITVSLLIVVAAAASVLLAAAGAKIGDLEVGFVTDTIGNAGDAHVRIGDNVDDLVYLQSGSGDPVVASVNAGTPALLLSGMLSPGAGLPGIVTLHHQSRARWSLKRANQIVPPGVWVPIEFDFDATFSSPDHFDEHIESMPGSPGVPWTFTPAEAGYYQVNSRTEVLLLDEAPPDLSASPPALTLPQATAISIAIFKNGVNHSQGNNLQMISRTSLGGGPIDPPHEHDVRLYGNNAPNVADVVYLTPADILDIRVFIGQAIPAPGLVPNLLAEVQATYVSVHKLS